jgi:hypothetical protein
VCITDFVPISCSQFVLKLYNDLSTWQSDLKKTVISIAPLSYLLVPPALVSIQECANWVEHAAAELIKELFFLWFGVENQVSDLLLITTQLY